MNLGRMVRATRAVDEFAQEPVKAKAAVIPTPVAAVAPVVMEKIVERVVEKPIYIDRVVEKVVEKIVEKPVYVDRVVEKIVEVPVEAKTETDSNFFSDFVPNEWAKEKTNSNA